MDMWETFATDTISEHEIITRILNGEENLYALIVGRYNQRLYRVAMSIINDDAELKDDIMDKKICQHHEREVQTPVDKMLNSELKVALEGAISQFSNSDLLRAYKYLKKTRHPFILIFVNYNQIKNLDHGFRY